MLKMRSIVLLGCVLIGPTACGAASLEGLRTEKDVTVTTGTSFGMCIGYCSRTVAIDSERIRITERSWDPDRNPARTREESITAGEWAEIAQLASESDIPEGNLVMGCPDCADGGAEFVEVQVRGRSHKLTFEYGRPVPRADALVAKLRAVRSRFQQ